MEVGSLFSVLEEKIVLFLVSTDQHSSCPVAMSHLVSSVQLEKIVAREKV